MTEQKIKIHIHDNYATDVEINGTKIDCIKMVSFKHLAGGLPILTIELNAHEVDIEGECFAQTLSSEE